MMREKNTCSEITVEILIRFVSSGHSMTRVRINPIFQSHFFDIGIMEGVVNKLFFTLFSI
jgi:hypothetical protein